MTFVRWLLWDGGWFWAGLVSCFVFVVFPLGLESMLDRGDAGSGSLTTGEAGSSGTRPPARPGTSVAAPLDSSDRRRTHPGARSTRGSDPGMGSSSVTEVSL